MSPAPGEQLAHYRLIEQIGEGGMGVVWKAEDTRLNRHVALKILPPHHLEDEERRLRFMREARAAAAVNHPAIAAVYEVGEADELIYIAMELVEGTTLRERMETTGGLPLRDTFRFAVEMAEALASAHEAGIVHRDLKPENVMIRPDRHVKILDFGLAKLLEPGGGAADEDEPVGPDAETRLDHMSAEKTQQGRIFGTAAYMSPEQARGQAVDHRSDVFSLGVVLYEMITGTSPFRAETTTDTLSAIVRDTPRDPAQLNPHATGETGRILTKCLEKDPADRYQHTDELAADLRKLRRDSESQPLTRTSGPQSARHPAPWKRALPWAAAAGVLLLLAALFLLPRLRDGAAPAAGDDGPRALAVMPFENLSDAEDRERLGQILQELIITDLSGHEALDVVSSQRLYDIHRQLAGGQSGRSIDRASFTEVAGRADATTLLTGTLSRLGERWIIAGQMADLATGRVLQSERIDGDDLYHMVSDLTRRIRSDLLPTRVGDTGRPPPPGAAPPPAPPDVTEQTTTSLDAYQRYLEGVELLSAREYQEAAQRFEQALELDPGFGQATLRLAIARWWMGTAERPQGPVPPKQLVRRLLEGQAKLPPRDRRLAEGVLAVLEERYQEAEDVLTAMTRRHPEDKEAWYLLGEARYHRNPADLRGATEAFTQALELDPSFETAYSHLGKLNLEQRRYDTQIRQLRGLMRSDPDHRLWHEELYHALLARGRNDEAEQVLQASLERFPEDENRRKLWLSATEAWLTVDDRRGYLECLRQVVALAPEHPETLIAQGRVPAWDGRWAEAAALYQRALDAGAEGEARVDALQRLTLMAINLGQVDEATRHATGIAIVSGNKAAPTGLLVRAYLSGGRPKQAAEILEDGLNRQEDDNARRAVLAGPAWSYLGAGQADQAEALTRRGLALEGSWETERQLRDNLPEILLHQGRLDEAEQAAERALELMPHSLDPERMLALIALARNDPAGAAARYRRLIEEGPATSWLRAELAVALAEQGKFEAAEREARAAFEASPGRREHEALAWVLVAGELDVARGMKLAEAAAARPDWWGAAAFAAGRYFLPSAEHALGLGLLKSGRGVEAVGVLERAVALQPGRVGAVEDLAVARGLGG